MLYSARLIGILKNIQGRNNVLTFSQGLIFILDIFRILRCRMKRKLHLQPCAMLSAVLIQLWGNISKISQLTIFMWNQQTIFLRQFFDTTKMSQTSIEINGKLLFSQIWIVDFFETLSNAKSK